ncbi:hypothetical protein Ahy_A04g020691 [Arachis hypogaea]|uniref:Uncharacterized protein n=1 Tax=Arachis hypogaea TaxID=3818 RepID=A0A445DIC7_ARAHY|nr:hypothetical protein Ahy_A04g020691 [Arachis hypogaea]
MLEQNLEDLLTGIDKEHWRWFLDYRNDHGTKKKYGQNTLNQSKELYTHTGGSKSLARQKEEEDKISEIEQHDESMRILSENDSLAQALRKEYSGRVRDVGFRPILSQIFHLSSQPPKLKRKAVDDEVAAEKLKRKGVEDDVATEKMKRQAIDSGVATRHRCTDEFFMDMARNRN